MLETASGDPIAAQVAAAGFRVVRPRPRGFGRSVGAPRAERLDGLTHGDSPADATSARLVVTIGFVTGRGRRR